MTTSHPAGWYPDPQGRSDHRYYDGNEWTDQVSRAGVVGTDPVNAPAPVEEPQLPAPTQSAQLSDDMLGSQSPTETRALDAPAPTGGNAWVKQSSSPPPPVAAGSKPSGFDARASLGSVSEKLATVKVPKRLAFIGLAAGCAAVALGSLMPWAKTSARGIELYSSGPKSGASFMFIVLAGIALFVGWPLMQDGISRGRALGLAGVVALLGLFALTNWASLADAQPESAGSDVLNLGVEVTAGGGLLLYTLGVVVLVAVAVLAFLRGKATVQPA